MNKKLPDSQDHEKTRNINPEFIDQNSKNKQIRKPKEYKIVLEFFVKTLYVNVGLNQVYKRSPIAVFIELVSMNGFEERSFFSRANIITVDPNKNVAKC